MNTHNTSSLPDASSHSEKLPQSGIYERLQEIYWAKKELEEFLPNIAKYAKPDDLVSIALAQLAGIEKQVIEALEELSHNEKIAS